MFACDMTLDRRSDARNGQVLGQMAQLEADDIGDVLP
jgi:hypothetical protein